MKQTYALIVLSSVTYARQVERLCERQGIFCTIGHTPQKIARKGCSYMVKVKMKDLLAVREIIDGLMLKTFGIFRKRGENEYDLLG